MSDFEERFSSLSRVYGEVALREIQQAHVCVVGLGGVGSWAAEALARNGVGRITLIDGDDIARSNINRQCHALESSIGSKKVDAMQQRILDINPECDCRIFASYLDEHNIDELLLLEKEQKYDCVIDAIDRIKYKALMIHFCKRKKIKIVATGGAGGLTDPTQIQVKDLSRTYNDPLASAVRLCLRQVHNFSRNLKRSFGVPCVYSTQQQRYPDKDGNIGFKKPGVSGLSLDCSFGYGSVVMVTASFGFVAAATVIDIVIKRIKKTKPD